MTTNAPAKRKPTAAELEQHLVSNWPPGSRCKGKEKWWNEQEVKYKQARTGKAAKKAAAAAVALCAECPTRLSCARLATTGKYWGLAAGAYYRDGVRIEIDPHRNLMPDDDLMAVPEAPLQKTG